MSILDDYNRIIDNSIENECKDYLNSIDKYDIPAFYQAWYDILKENFLELSNLDKIIYLNTLKDYFPRGLVYVRCSDNNNSNFIVNSIKCNEKTFLSGLTELLKPYIEIYSESYDLLPYSIAISEYMDFIDNIHTPSKSTKPANIIKTYYTDIDNIIDHTLLHYNIMNGFNNINKYLQIGEFRCEYSIYTIRVENYIYHSYSNEHLLPISSKYQDIKLCLEKIIEHRLKNQDII